MSSILSVGQSALAAAQAGLATTGHNIANASTPGYSRQVVVLGSAGGQNSGSGYIGKGAVVTDVRRVYNELLAGQVRSAQSAQVQSQTYFNQVSVVDNLLANSSGGVAPALQDFFEGVQGLASNVNTGGARQGVLSSAEALASRLRGLDAQLKELGQGVNGEIRAAVKSINAYAQQISKLNDAIEKAVGNSEGKAPNDLLDQRDHAISELAKEVKVNVVKQGNSYNVFVGNGQPVVVGSKAHTLVVTGSVTDQSRLQVGYETSGGETVRIEESMFAGGRLGGLFSFRSNSLDAAQNALGRIAINLAATFNAQHRLGQDQTGALGGDFFHAGRPRVDADVRNDQTAPVGAVGAAITDATRLTASDYRVRLDGTNYTITRLSDSAELYNGATFPEGQEFDGVTFSQDSPLRANDAFLVRPTADGAAAFSVAIRDVTKIAAAQPVRTEAPVANTGSGKISPASVDSIVLMRPTALTLTHDGVAPGGAITSFPSNATITVTRDDVTTTYPPGSAGPIPYDADDILSIDGVEVTVPTTAGTHAFARPTATLSFADGNLTGFPANLDVTVTRSDGSVDTYRGVTAATEVAYEDGDTISFGGVSFTLTGAPADGDTFTIAANSNGLGDTRNAVRLGDLQMENTIGGGSTTYQGAYAQLVSLIGNQTREMEVTSKAETSYLEAAVAAHEAESGVNLDEEATNLLRYQQAYQAAAKVMQTASTLFDTLLSLGN